MDTAGSLAVEARGVSTVRQVPAATADLALAHFAGKAAFETDCADVHAAFASGKVDFVGRDAYRKGHIAGAISAAHDRRRGDEGLRIGHTLRRLLRRSTLQWGDQGGRCAGALGSAGEGNDRRNYRMAR